MKCPRCGYNANPARNACPRCGARLVPDRPRGVRVPRVVRVRRGGKRRAAWYGPRAGYNRWRPSPRARRIALLAALAVALAALALAVFPTRVREPEPDVLSVVTGTPGPTATPSSTAAATATPGATASDVPGPTPSPEPVAVSGREDLIDLYWRMIYSGANTFALDAVSLSGAEFRDVTEKFSNYFDAYNASTRTSVVTMTLKPGLRVLHAVQNGETDALSDELRDIAERAQAVVAEQIRPGMTDLEKELAIHDYIAEHCEYLEAGQGVHTEDVRGFFQSGRCQCAGYVDTFRLLGRLAGLEIEMIGGPTTRDLPGTKGHAWNLIRLDGLWYTVDVTWDDEAGAGAPEHTYFNLPANCFGASRSWDQSCCPDGDYADAVDDKYYYGGAAYAAGSRSEALASAVRQLDAGGPAYIRFTGEDLAREVSADLIDHYGARGRCIELSEDLDIALYRFARS